MGFLIDSNVLIAAERERFSLTDLASQLADEPLALSAVTASELLHGVHRAKEASRREQRSQFVEFLLDLFPVVPFDLEAARVHAELWAMLQTSGTMVSAHDLIIAATACAINYGLVTANVGEFQRIPGLTVLNPLD